MLRHVRLSVAHQVPPFMEFSRQEFWSSCHFLLQAIFPAQGSNPCPFRLWHRRVDSSPPAPPGKPCDGPGAHLTNPLSSVSLRGRRIVICRQALSSLLIEKGRKAQWGCYWLKVTQKVTLSLISSPFSTTSANQTILYRWLNQRKIWSLTSTKSGMISSTSHSHQSSINPSIHKY